MSIVSRALGLARVAVVLALLTSLALVAHELQWDVVAGTLAAAHWPSVLVAIILALVAIWTKSVRWQGLLAPTVRVGGAHALGLVLAGQLVNNGLPLRVGEVARVVLLDPGSAGRAYVVSTVVAEKLLDAGGLVVAAALLALAVPLPEWLRLAAPALTLLAAVGFVGAVWLTSRYGTASIAAHAGGALAGLGVLSRPPALARAIFWTAGSLAAGAAANWWSLRAIGIEPALAPAVLVLLALYVGGALPAPPGRIGVFQALCVAALLPFGVVASAALAFGLLHYAVVILAPSLLGGLYVLAYLRWHAGLAGSARRSVGAPAERRP